MELDQYDIFLVNPDSTIDSEIKKTRPYVIISPNEINDNLRIITIAPMITKNRKYPNRVKVKHNKQIGWVVLDQIRTID
jgi:mRNA interferase MazF